jgi:vacuolar protein sorting-associated protein VTA1
MFTRKTAKSFNVAGSFFDVLKQFGELDPEVAEMSRYAKWKALDIMKAIREGRVPVSGPPDEVRNVVNP